MSSPSERLAFSLDETSVDPSARSSITPTQSLDSIVRGRALMHPSALAARLGPHLLNGLPEAECAVGDGKLGSDGQPAPPKVEQQLPPGLHALAHAIDQADELLLALRGGADDHKKALGVRFEAGLHVDAVDPEVDVTFGREIALGPPGMLARPSLLESGDTRGGQP